MSLLPGTAVENFKATEDIVTIIQSIWHEKMLSLLELEADSGICCIHG